MFRKTRLSKLAVINLPSTVLPLSQLEINLLFSTGKSRTNVSKPPGEQKEEEKTEYIKTNAYIYL